MSINPENPSSIPSAESIYLRPEESRLISALDKIMHDNEDLSVTWFPQDETFAHEDILAGKLPYGSDAAYDVVITRRSHGQGVRTVETSEVVVGSRAYSVIYPKITSHETGSSVDSATLCGLATWISQARYSLDLSLLVKTNK